MRLSNIIFCLVTAATSLVVTAENVLAYRRKPFLWYNPPAGADGAAEVERQGRSARRGLGGRLALALRADPRDAARQLLDISNGGEARTSPAPDLPSCTSGMSGCSNSRRHQCVGPRPRHCSQARRHSGAAIR